MHAHMHTCTHAFTHACTYASTHAAMLKKHVLPCDTANIGLKVLRKPTAKLETHSYLRNKTTGYYFRLQSIIKPLASIKLYVARGTRASPAATNTASC
eukprot:6202159-Pleurochrysis_carterae.AAC.3